MKKTMIVAVTGAALAVITATAWTAYTYLTPRPASFEAVTLHNPDDDQEVATAARDVFRATVQRHTGTRTIQNVPSDLYEVRITHTYKGNLNGTVTVTQTTDEPALLPGHTYVVPTVPWNNPEGEHAVLAETLPRPADDPDAPATTLTGTPHGTIDEHWTWAATHPSPGINTYP
ncbi:hypothetical protein [Streptomyces sp. NPDC001787]|uniref:hypothetical protein n=1 Tax=Streptomyces sp. NPDC001787 TaxID=3154523 RepID=UPI00331FFA1B